MRCVPSGATISRCVLIACAAACSTQLDAPDSTFAKDRCAQCEAHFSRYLAAPRPLPHVRFGELVAVSGTSVAVSAPFENASGTPDDPEDAPAAYVPNGEGVTYVFDMAQPERPPLRLVAPNADPGDAQVTPAEALFLASAYNAPGFGLAMNEDFLVVGAPGEDSALAPRDDGGDLPTAELDNAATDAGAVYVYARSDLERGRFEPMQYIKAPKPAARELFGFGVALSNTELVVGAPGNADDASNTGAVYDYALEAGGFRFRQRVKPKALHAGTSFGVSVAIDGDRLVVGAPLANTKFDDPSTWIGAAYVYERVHEEWRLDATLGPGSATPGSLFGGFVRVAQGRIVVAAPFSNDCPGDADSGPHRGAVHVFERERDAWVSKRCLGPAKRGGAEDIFGFSLGVNGDLLVAGAGWDDSGDSTRPTDHSLKYAGAAYIEDLADSSGQAYRYIKAPKPGHGDVFGVSVDLGTQFLAVGASQRSRDERGHPAPVYSGAVYVFRLAAARASNL